MTALVKIQADDNLKEEKAVNAVTSSESPARSGGNDKAPQLFWISNAIAISGKAFYKLLEARLKMLNEMSELSNSVVKNQFQIAGQLAEFAKQIANKDADNMFFEGLKSITSGAMTAVGAGAAFGMSRRVTDSDKKVDLLNTIKKELGRGADVNVGDQPQPLMNSEGQQFTPEQKEKLLEQLTDQNSEFYRNLDGDCSYDNYEVIAMDGDRRELKAKLSDLLPQLRDTPAQGGEPAKPDRSAASEAFSKHLDDNRRQASTDASIKHQRAQQISSLFTSGGQLAGAGISMQQSHIQTEKGRETALQELARAAQNSDQEAQRGISGQVTKYSDDVNKVFQELDALIAANRAV